MQDKMTNVCDYISNLNSRLEKVIKNGHVTLGLFRGKMGWCIYFYCMHRLTGNTQYKKTAEELLDAICNTSKMEYLYTPPVVGGGVFLNREKFINAGLENEKHYGWGNDDWDRYYRFLQYDYRIFHMSNVLFHLAHPRTNNSKFRTALQGSMSKDELLLTKSRSPEETRKHINN